VRLNVDGHQVVTGPKGATTFTAEHNFLPHTLVLVDTTVRRPDRHYQFSRWEGQRDPNKAFAARVTGLPLRSNYTITAAFTVQFPVTPRLLQESNAPVDLSQVSAITIKSDSGELIDFPKSEPLWLDGLRPLYRQSALTAEPVTYSLQSVTVRGANVVDSGRQTFQPSVSGHPLFITQFHDLTITAHDAMFGSATGGRAVVTFPDGQRQTVALDGQHRATLTDLPRGNYTVVVKVGLAIVAASHFTLSRDKTVDLTAITTRDLIVLGGALLLICICLLAIGRSRLHRRFLMWLRRSRQQSTMLPRREDVLI
jgi:hypothetical protein